MADPITPETKVSTVVETYRGEAIPLSDTYPLSSSETTRFVVLVGTAGAGKSTFIARLFDRFQDGPIGALSFAGSKTMIGFERVLAPHRAKILEGESKTARTERVKDPDVLHLKLKKMPEGESFSFLIANVSGELFNDLIKTKDSAETLRYIQRANVIVFVLNAANFSDRIKADEEVRNMRMLIDRLRKSNFLPKECLYQIIYSKCDRFASEQDQELKQYIRNEVEKNLTTPLSKDGIAVQPSVFETQAQPYSDILGQEEVLTGWCLSAKSPHDTAISNVSSDRLFDLFGQKGGSSGK